MEKVKLLPKCSEQELQGLPLLDSDEVKCSSLAQRRSKWNKMKSLSLPDKIESKGLLDHLVYNISEEYLLTEKLGFGTYSEVRKAFNKKTNQEVAIKISRGSTACRYLRDEAEILKVVDSDYIPKFYDFKQDARSNRSYLIMEYVKGCSLDMFIQQNGTLAEEDADKLLAQLIKAVEALHSKGIAHRDIKPQNILITEEKELKLIDFNISKMTKERSMNSESRNKFNCVFFTQISSPLYAAPEISSLSAYSESVDIWGIGMAYAEMLFNVSSLAKEEQPVSKVIEDLDSEIQISDSRKLILREMLEKDPSKRPSSYELAAHFG